MASAEPADASPSCGLPRALALALGRRPHGRQRLRAENSWVVTGRAREQRDAAIVGHQQHVVAAGVGHGDATVDDGLDGVGIGVDGRRPARRPGRWLASKAATSATGSTEPSGPTFMSQPA